MFPPGEIQLFQTDVNEGRNSFELFFISLYFTCNHAITQQAYVAFVAAISATIFATVAADKEAKSTVLQLSVVKWGAAEQGLPPEVLEI